MKQFYYYEIAERIAHLLEQEGWQVDDLLYIEEMLRNEKKRQPSIESPKADHGRSNDTLCLNH